MFRRNTLVIMILLLLLLLLLLSLLLQLLLPLVICVILGIPPPSPFKLPWLLIDLIYSRRGPLAWLQLECGR